MIYDCFTYNGEKELLDLHLNVLNQYVDQFIIVESPTTFSGQRKPLYFEKHQYLFEPFLHKIKYYINTEDYTEEEKIFAESHPNTVGASHWKHEFLQKESIKNALHHIQDNDIVFIGDVDEIWNPEVLRDTTIKGVNKLKLKVYTYYLNNLSSEEFWGPIMGYYDDIKDKCLNELRTLSPYTDKTYGWHFTSMGGYEELKRKLENSYTEESYANDTVMDNLQDSIIHRRDFLGRDFCYIIDESYWPKFLQDNRSRYDNLILNL